MKKAMIFAAAALMATPAFASKARQAALGGAVTTNDDVQEVFNNPAKMFNIGDQLTVEYGADKEGGFFRSHGDTKWGVYFGNHSTTFDSVISQVNGGAATGGTALPAAGQLLREQNAIDLFYGAKAGELSWALGLHYTNGERKAVTTPTAAGASKSQSMGLRAGVSTDMWEAYTNIGLSGSAKNDASVDLKNEPTVKVGGEYFMGDTTVYAEILTGGAKASPSAGGAESKVTSLTYTIGVESKIKAEGAHFFYGAALMSSESKIDTGDVKRTTMNLPIYAGLEADAASWLVVRGFVKQSVLLNTAKNSSAAGTSLENNNLADTSAGLGAGLKFGKLMVDGAVGAGTAGDLNSTNLMSNVSLNYWF